jgi:hypothetical protein
MPQSLTILRLVQRRSAVFGTVTVDDEALAPLGR